MQKLQIRLTKLEKDGGGNGASSTLKGLGNIQEQRSISMSFIYMIVEHAGPLFWANSRSEWKVV